jgi:membrane-associated phospholipid phosphatase
MQLFPNGRGVGVTEALHGVAEWPVVLLFGLVTQLGDGWFLFVLGGALFVAGEEFPLAGVDRRRALFVFALALTYVAVIGALKGYFGLGRPPGATGPPALAWAPAALSLLLESATTADGPGFPSGHALGTTMVWGGLALVVDWGTARQRLGGAAAVIGLVSLSRLVLGVHYLVDVVVGIGVGAVLLGGKGEDCLGYPLRIEHRRHVALRRNPVEAGVRQEVGHLLRLRIYISVGLLAEEVQGRRVERARRLPPLAAGALQRPLFAREDAYALAQLLPHRCLRTKHLPLRLVDGRHG